MMENLIEIENRRKSLENDIKETFGKDNKNWVQLYRLMEKVKTELLFRPEFHSFTEWVNDMAKEQVCSPSTFWHRRKAGLFYDAYYQRAVKKGVEAKPLEEIYINPENLNIIEKIAAGDEAIGDELIEKFLKKEISYSDLRSRWQDAKDVNNGVTRKNGYNEIISRYQPFEFEALVIDALKSPEWLMGEDFKKLPGKRYRRLRKVRVLPDGSRPDAIVLDAIDFDEEVKLHLFEIKTRLFDLFPLDRLQAYVRIMGDYAWLVLPDEEVESSRKIWEKDEWARVGVIGYSEKTKKLTIYKRAKLCSDYGEADKRLRKLDAVIKELM